MTVLLICNTGAGFAQNIEVTDGITVSELFKKQCPNGKPGDYLIRVNRQPTTSDAVLQPGGVFHGEKHVGDRRAICHRFLPQSSVVLIHPPCRRRSTAERRGRIANNG